MAVRKIVEIDEALCDGCGLCIPECAEGALQIIDGKAKLVNDVLCDGFGDCLGHCPQNAIRIIERVAEQFDEEAVNRHLADQKQHDLLPESAARREIHHQPFPTCPGSVSHRMNHPSTAVGNDAAAVRSRHSALGNWPVQLHLLNPMAPFLENADLLLCADCVPFAYPDFPRQFLTGKVVAIGCPKLDQVDAYIPKLQQVFRRGIRSLTIVKMEVPCCSGIVRIAEAGLAGIDDVPKIELVTIGIQGDLLQRRILPARSKKPA